MAGLESAALSGELFQPHHSPSSSRSTSTPSPSNTDDELGSDLSRPPSPTSSYPPSPSQGPQTGPKGVISDRRAHAAQARHERDKAYRDEKDRQERKAMVGMTVHEEQGERERERLLRETQEEEGLREWRRRRKEEMQRGEVVKRGGLREVGREGFVSAVERKGWVIILIYEPDVPRCNALLASTLQLSLQPSLPLSIYRARATQLAFSLLPTAPGEEDGEPQADPDVLPTLLAYRDGELEKTWIRVDWEVGDDGVEGLLKGEGILGEKGSAVQERRGQNLLDEEDDD